MKTSQIFKMLLLVLVSISSIAQNKNSSSLLFTKIDSYLESGTKNGFAGAITVIKNGKVVINKGYGFANRDTQLQNNPNTIFDIGSNTKQFTAAAILKLTETGKLTVNDPLSQFFPSLPKDKQSITIHHLLSHTSGFTETIGNDFDETTRQQFFETLFASELIFEPGESYEYSNVGYSILGRIIELASGLDYEEFLNQNLFSPAGMYQTGYLLPEWDTAQISRSYNRGVLESESPILKYQKSGKISWHLKANGGINSTQNDMILWYKALKSNKIISRESLIKLTTAYVEYPGGTLSYGYGWTVKLLDNNIKRIAHNGSNGAYAHTLIWFPEQDSFISYATNANSEKVEYTAYTVAKMLLDQTFVPKPIDNNVYAFAVSFIKTNNINKSEKLIKLLKENYPKNFTSSKLLNSIGNILLLINEHHDWSVELFKRNIELYPNDGNLWDSLGDGYLSINQKNEAIKSYQKAIELGYKDSQKKLYDLAKN